MLDYEKNSACAESLPRQGLYLDAEATPMRQLPCLVGMTACELQMENRLMSDARTRPVECALGRRLKPFSYSQTVLLITTNPSVRHSFDCIDGYGGAREGFR